MAIICSIMAIITDYLDGYIARKRGEVTELGKILDPLADKIAIALGTIALYYAFNLPLWILLVILLRDILIVLGAYFLLGKIKHVISSDFPGKIAVTVISFLILIYLLELEILKPLFIILTVIAITVSFIFYLYKFIKIFNTD